MELTKAEEQVMKLLWKQEKAFVKELVKEFPEPKPAYNTVSTIVRILEKKGVVAYEAFGKTHQYYPLITQHQYRKQALSKVISDFFKGSKSQLVAHLIKEQNMDVAELDAILKELKTTDHDNA